MDLLTAMEQRHSVRSYSMTSIDKNTLNLLKGMIDTCNKESGLHIQLVIEEPLAFSSRLARYGNFEGVKNYIVMAGRKNIPNLDETCGYYGEKLVLFAQQLGLNTCWVGLTYKRIDSFYTLEKDEKVVIVIYIGYGNNQGIPHNSKSKEDISNIDEDSPSWFKKGLKYALLAPTALNQQKFIITYVDGIVEAKAGFGPFAKVDLGIVKYHFELGAGIDNFTWK